MLRSARTPRPRRSESGERVVRIQSAYPDFSGGYRLTVPASVARMVGPDVEFAVELADDGILYRKVSGQTQVSALPEWLR